MMKKIFAIAMMISVFGCSKIETGLTFAPRLATNKIDDAFDFNSGKLSQIRKQIDLDIQGSKKTLATKLIAHIETVESYSAKPEITRDQLLTLFNDFASTQTLMLEGFRHSAEVTLKNLSNEEIENFKKYSAKKYAEELALAKDKKAFLKKKRQQFEKNYELFFNDLSDEQETLLTNFLDSQFEYFKERIIVHQKFADEFYMHAKSKDPVLDFFLSHYEGKKFDAIQDASLKGYLEGFFQFQIAFWKSTSPKQKERFKKMLKGYKEELQKMAAKA